MKVKTEGFKPIVITLETVQEYAAFIEILKQAWKNTDTDEPASDLCEEFANALDFDVKS